MLSVLHRLSVDANLSLGNKKSVDIAVVRGAGDGITLGVKGLARKTWWPIDSFREGAKHFLTLVCCLGQIDDPTLAPEVYIVPSKTVASRYNGPGGRKPLNFLP